MNNNQQSLTAALTAFQSSLERMNMSLVDSFKPSLLASSSAFQPALLEFQRSIAQTMTISLQNDTATQLQAQFDALTAPVRQMQEMWNASLVSGIRDTLAINDSVIQDLTKNFQQNLMDFSSYFSVDFSSIAKSILEIQVYRDYVKMPETFIPDDFLYEEVPDNLETIAEQDAEKSSTTKRLSLSDALNIINMIVVLLMTIIAPFWNHAVERSISKTEDAEAIAPISEDQAQQMLEYLSELTNCQETILKALEASEELDPEQNSYSDDIQHLSATPDSLWIENDEFPPTSANEPNNFEQR